MKGDFHVRFRENLRVKLPWVTRLCLIIESQPHIQAHLVFADTQSQTKKPKELEFFQRTDNRNKIKICIFDESVQTNTTR